MYQLRYTPGVRLPDVHLTIPRWKDCPHPQKLAHSYLVGTHEGTGQIASQREPQLQRSLQELGYDNKVARRLRVGYNWVGKSKDMLFWIKVT